MENIEIAGALRQAADLMEMLGANPFRVRAYRHAGRVVYEQEQPLRELVAAGGDLTELPGIGRGVAAGIHELLTGGQMEVTREMLEQVPSGLLEVKRIPGLGTRKVRRLWEELGVESIDDLEEAASAGAVAEMAGFGAKTQDAILAWIQRARSGGVRFQTATADELVVPLLEHVRGWPGIERAEPAGDARRRTETVDKVVVLAQTRANPAGAGATPPGAADILAGFPAARGTRGGADSAAGVLRSRLPVEVHVVAETQWGSAWVELTGSATHLEQITVSGGATTEEEVYRRAGLAWIPPELREGRGEVEAAASDALPRLIETNHIRGDIHMHSTWSDGRASIEEMVAACARRGYEYMAITDHSPALAMVQGLDEKRLGQQFVEIEQVQAAHPQIRILRGMEVDILRTGELDLADEMLAELDIVIISVHSHFGLPPAEQTRRVLRAVGHPRARIFGHMTGRLVGRRPPIDIDVTEVLAACAEFGVAVEANANPRRLDLRDEHLALARETGVPVVVNTDAHRPTELGLIRHGIDQARRAGLTAGDVLNTMPLPDLLAALR
ncbi:MAG: PHP domain-containing protein [Gemmatimonadetes bacterium]|nr:PHP domain-containing protein [Gemmatimonadota bacterium]